MQGQPRSLNFRPRHFFGQWLRPLCRSHRSGPQKLMQSPELHKRAWGMVSLSLIVLGVDYNIILEKKHDGLSSRKPVGIPKIREVMIFSGLKDFKSRMCWRHCRPEGWYDPVFAENILYALMFHRNPPDPISRQIGKSMKIPHTWQSKSIDYHTSF